MKQSGSERMWLRQSFGQEKSREKGSVEEARGWERGRQNITYSQALTNQPHIAWPGVKCDNCSQSLSESASCSSTPGKANVMAAHKLKSLRRPHLFT